MRNDGLRTSRTLGMARLEAHARDRRSPFLELDQPGPCFWHLARNVMGEFA